MERPLAGGPAADRVGARRRGRPARSRGASLGPSRRRLRFPRPGRGPSRQADRERPRPPRQGRDDDEGPRPRPGRGDLEPRSSPLDRDRHRMPRPSTTGSRAVRGANRPSPARTPARATRTATASPGVRGADRSADERAEHSGSPSRGACPSRRPRLGTAPRPTTRFRSARRVARLEPIAPRVAIARHLSVYRTLPSFLPSPWSGRGTRSRFLRTVDRPPVTGPRS